jgi:hypothetical protein
MCEHVLASAQRAVDRGLEAAFSPLTQAVLGQLSLGQLVLQVAPVVAVAVCCAVMAHGLLDFYAAGDLGMLSKGRSGRFNRAYELALLLFAALLFIQPALAVLLFIAGSVAHFGEDYRYLLKAPPAARSVAALLFAGSACSARNAASWAVLMDIFSAPGAGSTDSPAAAQAAGALAGAMLVAGGLAFIWLAAARQWRALLLGVVLGVVGTVCGPDAVLLGHLAVVHTPLAVYRVAKHHGLQPVLVWLACSVGLTIMVMAMLHLAHAHASVAAAAATASTAVPLALRLALAFGVSVTMPHMALTTLWQHRVDGSPADPEAPGFGLCYLPVSCDAQTHLGAAAPEEKGSCGGEKLVTAAPQRPPAYGAIVTL